MSSPLTYYLKKSIVYCQYYANDRRAQVSTGLKVDAKLYSEGKLKRDESALLRRLETVIDLYEVDCRQSGRPTDASEVENLIRESLGKKKVVQDSRDSFIKIFTRYLDDVKAGIILNDGARYSQSWIDIAATCKKWIEKSPIEKIPVSKITENDLSIFTATLTAAGLSKNTVACYIDPIVSILNGARRLGWFKGNMLESKAFRTRREDIDHGVKLTAADQLKILKVELDGKKAVWRDAFIFGCQLGMRHSDLSRVTKMHRQDDLININTTKTNTPIWVPLNTIAKELWEKNDGTFNLPTLTTFMLFAKDLGELAGLNKKVLFSRTEGGKRVERWVETWELMGTHTMRRSFATNAYLAGVPMPSIMKVTGHKSTANFMKYLKLTDEEHATLLLDHSFFKS